MPPIKVIFSDTTLKLIDKEAERLGVLRTEWVKFKILNELKGERQ